MNNFILAIALAVILGSVYLYLYLLVRFMGEMTGKRKSGFLSRSFNWATYKVVNFLDWITWRFKR